MAFKRRISAIPSIFSLPSNSSSSTNNIYSVVLDGTIARYDSQGLLGTLYLQQKNSMAWRIQKLIWNSATSSWTRTIATSSNNSLTNSQADRDSAWNNRLNLNYL